MIKCYLTKVDKAFDPNKDIAIGPWCLEYEQAKEYDFIVPYAHDEVLFYYRKLFDLTFYLLNKDIRKRGLEEKLYQKLYQLEYLHLVYIFYSTYRTIKKFLDTHEREDFCIEFVEKPKKILFFNDETEIGYLFYVIFCCLVKNKKTFNSLNDNDSKEGEELDTVTLYIPENNWLGNLKSKVNYFSEVNGIKFTKGVLLSFLYKIVNLKKRKIVTNDFFDPGIESTNGFSEFMRIWKKVSDDFLPKWTPKNGKTRSLEIHGPVPPFYSDKDKGKLVKFFHDGGNLVIFQHGSSYCTLKNNFQKEIEYNCGRFLTWGKEFESYLKRNNIINNLPYPYISSLANRYKFNNQDKILWMSLYHLKSTNGLSNWYGTIFIDYLKKKEELWDKLLEANVRKLVMYRYFPCTGPEHFYDVLIDKIPTEQHFIKELSIDVMLKSKIVFLDCYGTGFYEAMSMNVPVVMSLLDGFLFWTEKAAEIFARFEQVGVVHRTVESVAKFLNNVPDMDTEKWWNSDEIQSIRQDFLTGYANNKPYFWPWVKAILKREL